jgi:hypothetical protein
MRLRRIFGPARFARWSWLLSLHVRNFKQREIMATYITQQDVNQLLHFAALSAAQKVGIAEAEWEPADKLVAAVSVRDALLGAALGAFIKAYVEWLEFGEKIETSGKAGNMSSSGSLTFYPLW